jgi:site-specific DNA-methyltransferase (adenine-specific)
VHKLCTVNRISRVVPDISRALFSRLQNDATGASLPPMQQLDLGVSRSREAIDPYYADSAGRFHLVHGEAVATLAKIPDHSIDLVVTDPPYFLSTETGTTCSGGERVAVSKGAWDESHGLEADHAFHRAWLAQVRAVLKPSGTVWVSATHHALFSIGFAMQGLGFHVLNLVTWLKPNATPNLACRFFTHSTEHLIWAAPSERKPLPHYFNYTGMKEMNGGKQMRDYWSIPTPPAREKLYGRHPTQKPEDLLERVIRASSAPGDLVLDPFNGSGTTGVVAVRRGRRYIGIDLDRGYLDISRARITAELQRTETPAPEVRRSVD